MLNVAVAGALERGTTFGPLSRWLEGHWARRAARAVVKPLDVAPHLRTVTVGGATLGGSGKTPLAIACAAELASAGVRVALVGHGYRGRVARACRVGPADPVDDVGDEAILAARQLPGAIVIVAPTRAEAVDYAARSADVVVLDGTAQIAPRRASLALLAVDAEEPWGRAVACVPRGDLAAPPSALLAACDAVVAIGRERSFDVSGRPLWAAKPVTDGALVEDARSVRGARNRAPARLTWEHLSRARVGLVSALARPGRVLRSLATHSVVPCVHVRAPDHGPLTPSTLRACREASRRARIDVWLATPKCALHVERWRDRSLPCTDREILGAPMATLEYSIALPPTLCACLRALAACSSLLDRDRGGQ